MPTFGPIKNEVNWTGTVISENDSFNTQITPGQENGLVRTFVTTRSNASDCKAQSYVQLRDNNELLKKFYWTNQYTTPYQEANGNIFVNTWPGAKITTKYQVDYLATTGNAAQAYTDIGFFHFKPTRAVLNVQNNGIADVTLRCSCVRLKRFNTISNNPLVYSKLAYPFFQQNSDTPVTGFTKATQQNLALSVNQPHVNFKAAPHFNRYFEVLSETTIKKLSHGDSRRMFVRVPGATFCPITSYWDGINQPQANSALSVWGIPGVTVFFIFEVEYPITSIENTVSTTQFVDTNKGVGQVTWDLRWQDSITYNNSGMHRLAATSWTPGPNVNITDTYVSNTANYMNKFGTASTNTNVGPQ